MATGRSRSFLVSWKNLQKKHISTLILVCTIHRINVVGRPYSEHSARSDECWNASERRASDVLCKTFTPSKKNMSHTLSTDGHGSVLPQDKTLNYNRCNSDSWHSSHFFKMAALGECPSLPSSRGTNYLNYRGSSPQTHSVVSTVEDRIQTLLKSSRGT